MNKFAGGFAKSANVWRGLVAIFLVLTLIICFLAQLAYANKLAINAYLGLQSSVPV